MVSSANSQIPYKAQSTFFAMNYTAMQSNGAADAAMQNIPYEVFPVYAPISGMHYNPASSNGSLVYGEGGLGFVVNGNESANVKFVGGRIYWLVVYYQQMVVEGQLLGHTHVAI